MRGVGCEDFLFPRESSEVPVPVEKYNVDTVDELTGTVLTNNGIKLCFSIVEICLGVKCSDVGSSGRGMCMHISKERSAQNLRTGSTHTYKPCIPRSRGPPGPAGFHRGGAPPG